MSTGTTLTRRAFFTFRRPTGPASAPAADVTDFALSCDDIACAQLAEARPFLADEARRHGIPTENRTELEILRDVFAKAH